MARKKHSTRRDGRVLNRDAVAPPNTIRRDEIVEEVVDNLRPWKDHKSRDTVTAQVSKTLNSLLKSVPKKLFDRRPVLKHVKKLGKALSNVETLLLSSPGTLPLILFPPPPRMNEETIEEIVRQHKARIDPFIAELERLRRVCALKYGSRPNYDHSKNLCADFTYVLMRGLSDRKITGTEGQTFRFICGLLYEAISGHRDADLKRACDAVLKRKRTRELELGTDPSQ
jgi:hypothetical protein